MIYLNILTTNNVTPELQTKIDQLNKVFEYKTRERNGETENFACITLNCPQEIKTLLFEHNFEIRDFYYEVGVEAMDNIMVYLKQNDYDLNTLDDFDFYDYIEADSYTWDLTKWLHENVENVYYLSDVLQESQPTDGFTALALAQQKAMYEVYSLILETVKDYLKEE